MKALTVCQPYAELIARELKHVENRTWYTPYRGPLAIHAGKSRKWLGENDEAAYPDMAYGAIVAIVRLTHCCSLSQLAPSLRAEGHAFGPFCWVLTDVVRLARPIQVRGAQGLWDWRKPDD